MAKKLSEVLRTLDQKYEFTTGTLYRKGEQGKKCAVCALGGVALETMPDTFVINEHGSMIWKDRYGPNDDGGATEPGIMREFLKRNDLSPVLIDGRYSFKYANGETIASYSPWGFIVMSNDSNHAWAEIADALESFGL